MSPSEIHSTGHSAWAELTENGVTIGASWEDHGQGADMGMLAQSYEKLRPLKINIEDVKLVMNDMNITPNSGPAGGSRSTVLTGNAIANACDNLMEAMKKEDNSYMKYDEMISKGLPVKYDGKWVAPKVACDFATGQGDPFAVYMYGFLMTEVEVDIETGKTVVEKFTIISDVGSPPGNIHLRPPA